MRSLLVKHKKQLQQITLLIHTEILGMFCEFRMMLCMVLYKAKDSLHTSDGRKEVKQLPFHSSESEGY